MYDKLPISAFVSEPETPDPDMDLPNLQFWNCMDYGDNTVQTVVGSMEWEVRTRHFGSLKGEYICTLIDNYHGDPDVIDYSTSRNAKPNISHLT